MRRVVRSFLAFIASTFFGSLLVVSAFAIALRFTIVEPQTLKGWLSDSGVYESVVEEVGKSMTLQQANAGALVQISSKEIIDAAQLAFPSSSLEREGGAVIDGFYGWFRGDTSGPEFRADFTGEKADFAKIMADTLEAKIAELPECGDAGRFSVQAFDPFQADCRPKGVDLTQELVEFENQINKSDDFLPEPLFTGGDLQVDKNGEKERIGSAYPEVQRVYSALLWAPWAIAGLTLICLLGIIFFSSSRRKGLRRAASALLLSGISLVASGLFLGVLLRNTVSTSIASDVSQQSITENIVNPLLEQIIDNTYSKFSIYFGAGYLAVAVFMYGGLLFTRGKKQKPAHEQTAPDPEQSVAGHAVMTAQEPVQATQPPQPYEHKPPMTRPEPTAVPPLPSTPPSAPGQHSRPQRQVTRRPPMIQG